MGANLIMAKNVQESWASQVNLMNHSKIITNDTGVYLSMSLKNYSVNQTTELIPVVNESTYCVRFIYIYIYIYIY